MRKLVLLSAVLALGLSFAPAPAEPGNGCQLIGGETDVVGTCTYVATGGGTFVAATPNTWRITVVRDDQTIPLAQGGPAGTPSSGPIASLAGETVTLTAGIDCVPATPVCGWVGLLAVVETD